MDAIEIGGFLSELRKQKDLKQKEVAEALQVSDKAISRWETGRGIPDVDSLQRLSDFYEVSINEILAGRRIEQSEVEKVADQNLRVAVKKQFRLRNKLLTAMTTVIILLILLAVLVVLFVPMTYMTASVVMDYRVSGDDGMETLEEVFQVVDRLKEEEIDYSVSMETIHGEKYIFIVVTLPGKKYSLLSHPGSLGSVQVEKISGNIDHMIQYLTDIGYL